MHIYVLYHTFCRFSTNNVFFNGRRSTLIKNLSDYLRIIAKIMRETNTHNSAHAAKTALMNIAVIIALNINGSGFSFRTNCKSRWRTTPKSPPKPTNMPQRMKKVEKCSKDGTKAIHALLFVPVNAAQYKAGAAQTSIYCAKS